jgi:hypothetical protein
MNQKESLTFENKIGEDSIYTKIWLFEDGFFDVVWELLAMRKKTPRQ